GWAGRKLKLGENNKVDYATLVATDKWPAKINGVDIEVINPKYAPDTFVLVIRYVPQELDEKFVANEIQRPIASANHTSRIHGKLHRILPNEKAPTFELREQDFPALATNTVSQPPK
ncbi:unnamed protein product, partial [Rotaria sp. Silwood1]